MHIASVDKQMLSVYVSGSGGNEKHGHGRDFLSPGHPVFQRNLGQDGTQFLFRVRKGGEPGTVERRHHFRRDNRIHANPARQQFRSPFPGQRQDGAFR